MSGPEELTTTRKTDANWTRLDGLPVQWGPTQYSASSGAYELASATQVPLLNDFTIETASAYTASMQNPGAYADGVYQATVRPGTENSLAGLVVRGTLFGEKFSGYVFSIAQFAAAIYKVTNGDTDGQAPLAEISTGFAQNTPYEIQVTISGSQLSMKAWPTGSAEPTNPLLTANDGTFAQGFVGVCLLIPRTFDCSFPGCPWNTIKGTFDDVTFLPPCGADTSYGAGCAGSNGKVPSLDFTGCLAAGTTLTLEVTDGLANSSVLLFLAGASGSTPVGGSGCTLLVGGPVILPVGPLPLDGNGALSAPVFLPASTTPAQAYVQAWSIDPGAAAGAAGSDGRVLSIP